MLDLLISYINCLIILLSYIVKRITFQPPDPPGYIIQKKGKDSKKDIYFIVENDSKVKYEKKSLKGVDLEYINLHKNNKTVTELLIIKPYLYFPICIIYCHGNCGDLGYSIYDYYFLAKKTNCIVLAFEYPSYGSSKEIPLSENNLYHLIQNAYLYAKLILKIDYKNIFLYGFSLGTGIAFDLACRKEFPIGGIILQSPYLSIIKTQYNIKKFPLFDMFKNCEKAHKLNAPALFIHGNEDEIIPYIHGRILAKLIPKKYNYDFYTVKEGGHSDLFLNDKENIYQKIKDFISNCTGIKIENLLKQNYKLDTHQSILSKEKDNENNNISNNDKESIIDETANEETKIQFTMENIIENNEVKNNGIMNDTKSKFSNANESSTSMRHNRNMVINNHENSNIESYSNMSEQQNFNNQLIYVNIKENIYENINDYNSNMNINSNEQKKLKKIPSINFKCFTSIKKSLNH